ncbi:MAG: RluA family pseudouridine synthase [Candidatus Omnitrophica bacterium]|nr:RluA family pseudouridine synthase [Candidatus Omnitrophota bacterium]
MARTYRFVVGVGEAGMRLDRYLVRRLPRTLSRAAIQRAIHHGRVTIGGKQVRANDRLKKEDVVSATMDQLGAKARHLDLQPEAIPLEIVYEDDQALVVNKPAGLVVHPAPGHWSGTLVNAVLWHLIGDTKQFPKMVCVPDVPRAGIVHRLDKDTSGLLIVAKTELAHRSLSRQLKSRTLNRTYLALVKGHVPFEEGAIDAAIGRHQVRRKEMTVRYLGGREAVTRYRVLKRLTIGDTKQIPQLVCVPALTRLPFPYTLLEVKLQTGRTHQIRVHMAHLGHPVLGDVVYGSHPQRFWSELGIQRQLLHAAAIRFQHPTRNAPVELTAPLPQDMACWLPGVSGHAAD